MKTREQHLQVPSRLTYQLLGLSAVCLLACGSSSPPQIEANVSITSPANNSPVALPANDQIPVAFTTNYTLKTPGQCDGETYCGNVYLYIDSTACNLPGEPYNALAIASPVTADFSKCSTPTGAHTITLELHNDDESLAKTVLGNPVTDSVMVTTQ